MHFRHAFFHVFVRLSPLLAAVFILCMPLTALPPAVANGAPTTDNQSVYLPLVYGPPTASSTEPPVPVDGDRLFPAPLIADVRTYGAKGNGVNDDTTAIQQAICENLGRKMVYFPNGTYLVSSTLLGKDCNGQWMPYLTLMGQNRGKTVIRLKNDAVGFGSTSNPKAVIYTASGLYTGSRDPSYAANGYGNEAFRNFIENLTIDTGNNVGAIGIDYLASNIGAVRDVTIRGSGVTGLSMERGWPGPLLIKNVRIDGFGYGIATSHAASYGITLEHIQLTNQQKAGIRNDGEVISIHDLTSTNNVPAVENVSETGLLVLVDGILNGGASAGSAITNPWGEHHYHKGSLFLRHVTASGYRNVVQDGDETIPGSTIAEYSSNGQISLFPSKFGTLNLPIEEPPIFHDNNLNHWANVLDYGAVPNDWQDDGAAIQRALDAGKTTVYFPNGVYHVGRTLVVGGNVRRIIGPQATLSVSWGVFTDGTHPKPMFQVVDGTATDVTIEGISIDNHFQNQGDQAGLIGVEQATARPLYLKDLGCCNLNGVFKYVYRSTVGVGKLFIENVSASRWNFAYPQLVWARQFNPEGWDLHALSNGATLWVLGFKTEGRGMVIRTQNNGRTEVLGGVSYSSDTLSDSDALFENSDSQVALVLATSAFEPGKNWPSLVREIRNGDTRNVPNHVGEWRGFGTLLPLYVGAPTANGEPRTGQGTGLTGAYFDKPDFTSLKEVRIDDTVNFDWKSWFTPIGSISHTDNYSIRWTGKIEVPISGLYTFFSEGDDHAPLWIDGQQVVDTTPFGGNGTLMLQAGRIYDLRLEFTNFGGSSWVSLKWQPPGAFHPVVIPRTQLYPS